MIDRRTKEGYRLRIYMDQIKQVKAMTDEEWVNNWVIYPISDIYFTRNSWLQYLESCALIEAEKMAKGEAA